jgi:hypothetical protein
MWLSLLTTQLYAPNSALPLKNSINRNTFSKIIKSKIVTEISKLYRQEKGVSANITLIDFEQDFSKVTEGLVYSDFRVLFTLYNVESGHMMKAVNGKSYLAKITCSEKFNAQELKAYILSHSGTNDTELYSDICPWRHFKSYRVSFIVDEPIKEIEF